MARKTDPKPAEDLAARARRDGRTDEKLHNLAGDVEEIKTDVKEGFKEGKQAVVNVEKSLRDLVTQMAKDNENSYVTKGEFAVIRIIVFSFCGLVLSAFVTGLIALVFIVPGK